MRILTVLITVANLVIANFSLGQTFNTTLLKGDFYIYTTYKMLGEKLFPANGMYLVTEQGVVMFDSPWDTAQTVPLLDSIEARHNKKVILCVATHYHDDRTGSFDILKRKGIITYSSKQTLELCKQKNEKQAGYYFVNDTTFTVAGYTFQTYYPGEGHTPDNIVIWFSNEKILYGGCFVKSTENEGLGNVADANIAEWENSVTKTIKKFPKPDYIIPGHYSWADNNSLKHTLRLIKESKERK